MALCSSSIPHVRSLTTVVKFAITEHRTPHQELLPARCASKVLSDAKNNMPLEYRTVPLYGGAITASIPTSYLDVSTIREVPSTQELHLSRTGLTSVLIDLLTYIECPPATSPTDLAALEYHFSDIVSADTDTLAVHSTTPIKIPHLPNVPAYSAVATSTPKRRRESDGREAAFTVLLVTLVRLKAMATDVVVTVNVPHVRWVTESGKGEGEIGNWDGREIELGKGSEMGSSGALVQEGLEVRDRLLESLRVIDYGLFVDES